MARRPLEIGKFGKVKLTPHRKMAGGKPVRIVVEPGSPDPRGKTVTWRARATIRDFDGLNRSVEIWGPAKEVLERALVDILNKRIARTSDGLTRESTVVALADAYLRELDNQLATGKIKPATRAKFGTVVRLHILPGLGNYRLREVKYSTLKTHIEMIGKTIGPDTGKSTRSVLNAMMNLAVFNEIYQVSPMPAKVSLELKEKAPRALTKTEERALLDVLEHDPDSKAHGLTMMVRVMLMTGIRIGEACALRWSRVDLVKGTIYIDSTMTRVKGEGLLIQEMPKTSRSYRNVTLPARITQELREHKARQEQLLAQYRRKNDNDVVFLSYYQHMRDPSNTQQELKRRYEAAKLQDISTHIFRKTVATKLHLAQVPDSEIANQMGHTSISTTRRYYIGRSMTAAETNAQHLDLED